MTSSRHTVINEGKTKYVFEHPTNPGLCIIQNKHVLTKNNDPTQDMLLPNKGEWVTAMTANICKLFERNGLPVAYVGPHVLTSEFVAHKLKMIPLECIVRGEARGSFCKRHSVPEYGELREPVFEFNLKTTRGVLAGIDGTNYPLQPHQKGQEKVIDDPLIDDVDEVDWELLHPSIPRYDPSSRLVAEPVSQEMIFPRGVPVEMLGDLMQHGFQTLSDAFKVQGIILSDIKFEFGLDTMGNVCFGDTIDADCWRAHRVGSKKELSKEEFRRGAGPEEMAQIYAELVDITSKF